ncbi:hypothetical protein EYS14_14170 [Alteromonadaceae bacterium M269]|nr:hypothetical protein EYS14_14170 [Alteromonadaceae bacterium M269]
MKKVIITLVVLVVLLVGGALGVIAFLMNNYNYTFLEVVNRISVELGTSTVDDPLIRYSEKYDGEYIQSGWEEPGQLKVFSYLNQLNLDERKAYFQQRVNILKDKRFYTPDCDSINQSNMAAVGYCVATGEVDSYLFENLLMRFSFAVPKEVGSYGNALDFVMAYEHLKAVADVSPDRNEALQHKTYNMLDLYLQKLDGDSASLFHGRSVLASLALLLASQLEGESERDKAIIARAIGHFYDFYVALEKAEIWPEGYNYWINERALQVVMALEAFKSLTFEGESVNARVSALQQRIGYWHIYNTRPDWTIQGWADEGPRIDLRDETAKVMDYLSLVTDDEAIDVYSELLTRRYGLSSYWAGYRKLLPLIGSDGWFSPEAVSKEDRAVTLEPLDHLLPASDIFGKGMSNHVVIRSGWGANDTFIQFRASHIYTHHQHNDAGHFTLFKNTPLIVNASTYNGMNTENRMYFSSRSIAKNTLRILNPEESFAPDRNYKLDNHDGGQRVPIGLGSSIVSHKEWLEDFEANKYRTSDLLDYEHIPSVKTSIAVDITNAYNSIRYSTNNESAKVRRVVRYLTYLNDADLVVVYDKVTVIDPAMIPLQVYYMPDKPAQFGEEVVVQGSAVNGVMKTDSNLFQLEAGETELKVVNLTSGALANQVVGGPTYSQFVHIDSDLTTLEGRIFDQGYQSQRWLDIANWRVELPASSSGIDKNLISLLIPTGSNSTKSVNKVEENPLYSAWEVGSVMIIWVKSDSERELSLADNALSSHVVVISEEPGTLDLNGVKQSFDAGVSTFKTK